MGGIKRKRKTLHSEENIGSGKRGAEEEPGKY